MRNLGIHAKTFTLIGLALLVLAAGCGQRENAGPKKTTIALVMKSLANEFFITMENGAKDHQKANAADYKLTCNGIKDELDVNRQIQIVNQMVAKQVDAIVIAPADSKALIPVCRKAQDAGIVVVNIDNKFDAAVLQKEGVKIPFVGPDNRKGAKMAGDYLAKHLKEGDHVAIVEGVPGAFNGIQRKLGFEDAMKAAGMTIATSQSGHWETDKALSLVSQVMIKHGDALKAVLCANDSMALGAVQAIKDAPIKVIGFDNISAIQKLIKEGRVLCTVDQHGDQIAVNGIKYALDILKGGETPTDKETPVDLITKDTLTSGN